MKNFEQIRAKNALEWKDKIGGRKDGGDSVAKKVPVMILDNGIIAAAAFALEKGVGYENVFNAVINHLADIDHPADREIVPLSSSMSLKDFISHLVNCSSNELRLITAETMAYLNYLRRFAEKTKEK